ncbi:MAG: sulfatase [Acidimicrobiales bacterium]
MGQSMPKNLIVVLLDSLNRHMLPPYGGDEFAAPNIARFAESALRFTRHHAGSLPCMPARHDILVVALDFPWRPWGSIEVWEDAVTRSLREQGVTTVLISDHPHLFETGGENYHTDFTAWDYQRGHENDPWRTTPDPTWTGTPALPVDRPPYHHYYDDSRTYFRSEEDFPGPRTMSAAAQWIRTAAPTHDRFFLMVDEFDPHEPFDTPLPYAALYNELDRGPLAIWPPYLTDAVASGQLDPEKGRQIRRSYGAKLTMIDHWFAHLLEAIEQSGLADSTGVVLCTDHGHYLGEHDIFGKPDAPVYSELARIPLMVRWPGRAPCTVDALTTSVDLHATVVDLFGAAVEHPTHGRSLLPLIDGTADSIRELALFGYWGRHVGVTDGRVRYLRGCGEENLPLSVWSNRWSTMPIHPLPQLRLPRPDHRATLEEMPGTGVPVIRQPFGRGDDLPYWAGLRPPSGSYVFDTGVDPGELENRAGGRQEAAMADALSVELRRIGAPTDLLERIRIG